MTGNYFHDMIPEVERDHIHYIPTVPQFLSWIESEWGDRPALSDEIKTYTYNQVCRRVARRRTVLAEMGLRKGDLVGIWDRTTIDAVEMFLAVTSYGCVAINIPTLMPGQAVAGICGRFGVKALFAADELISGLPQVQFPVSDVSEIADTMTDAADIGREDPAAIFFTGGTTGTPKGAVLPHRALMRGAYNGSFGPGPQVGQRYICMLPLCHVFGMIRSTLSVLYTGSHWYACEDVKKTLGRMSVIKPTYLVLVPGLCDVIAGLAKMYGPGVLGGELKVIVYGAANVPPRLQEQFEELGVSLLAGYGMTEGANLTSGNIDLKEKPTSVGKIYPEQEVRIVDGELRVRGDNVFSGYYGNPEETARTLTPDGWLRTGDLVSFDDEGYMYITGRIKNLIILGNGENVSPESIEEKYYLEPSVKDCLVKEDEVDGEMVIAIEILPQAAYLEENRIEDPEGFLRKLVAEINRTMPTTHQVRKVTVRKEDFKRTGSMKVSRNQE